MAFQIVTRPSRRGLRAWRPGDARALSAGNLALGEPARPFAFPLGPWGLLVGEGWVWALAGADY